MSDVLDFFDVLLRCEIRLWNTVDGALQHAHGISLGRLNALRELRERGGRARVQDLAQALMITVGAASKLVDRLEGDGTARREPNPDDRRSSLITLTPVGARALGEGLATFEGVLAQALPHDVIAETDLASMTDTLARLSGHLESLAERRTGA